METIRADDYETHMAAAGQAPANAELVSECLRNAPAGAVLVAGAGTGQMFDYLDPATFDRFQTTFTDINPAYLDVLASRLPANTQAETVVDDIEDSRVAGPFALAMAVLVLEHVAWRRAVRTLCRLAPRVFVVIQQNPPGAAMVQPPVGTVAVLLEVPPHAVPREELEAQFARHGFALARESGRTAAGGKRMVGLEFAERVGS